MNKKQCLNAIQQRLPDDIVIEDETSVEFTEEEFIGILMWLKYFNLHYREKQNSELPEIIFPILSKRLRLDFGLYNVPSDTEINNGKHVIYISENGKTLKGNIAKQSLQQLIKIWDL